MSSVPKAHCPPLPRLPSRHFPAGATMLGKEGGCKERLCVLENNQQVISRWKHKEGEMKGEMTEYQGEPYIQAHSRAIFGADMLAR